MKASDFKSVVVVKNWGLEYECFFNGLISLWRLEIDAGKSTSMHAHINKRTGLVIIEGESILSFMYNSHHIAPLDKYNIHPRSFHKTTAKTPTILLEVEAPPIKHDLVRMSDDYGRAGLPYEPGPYLPKPQWIAERDISHLGDVHQHGDCSVNYHYLGEKDANADTDEVIIIASGGLVTAEKVQIVYPGDILWSWQLNKLLRMAEPIVQTEVLQIVKMGGSKI